MMTSSMQRALLTHTLRIMTRKRQHNVFRRTWLAALLVMLMGMVDGEDHGEVAVEVVDTTLEYKSVEAGSVIDL